MKKTGTCLILLIVASLFGLGSCKKAPSATPSVDSITAASGQFYYADSSYTPKALATAMKAYPYAGSITIATVNEDGTPNLAVAVPGLSPDGKYLSFGLSDNRTKTNMIERRFAVLCIYEYDPKAKNKADMNKGARIILSYPGDEENKTLNAGKKPSSLYMKIVKIIPLG